MGTEEPHVDRSPKGRLLLPALVLSMFLTTTTVVLVSTLLVNIASSLKVSIGTAIQIATAAALTILIMGFVMGVLTIRFKHKSLFLFGVAIYGVGALVFFFAQDFATAVLSQIVTGIGAAVMSIMVFSLIGELLPLEKRGWAVGLAWSTGSFAWISVAPLSGFIWSVAGWRPVLLWFIFPLSMACLALALFVIPSGLRQEQPPPKSEYLKAFKQIFSNTSAVACLVGSMLYWILNCVTLFAVSFYVTYFSVFQAIAAWFLAAAQTGALFGALGGGRLVNRVGRKTLTVAATFVAGIFAVLFTFVPNVWFSLAFWVVLAFSGAITMTALTSLVLEQVPEFRASMVSVNSTFGSIGGVLGLVLGGLVLNLYANNFQLLMTVFGAAGVASALIVFLLARDPTKTQLPSQSIA
jgi:DHA1 family inner membrane transport protein